MLLVNVLCVSFPSALAAPDSQTVNWQYETLSRNSAQIIQALANNRLAERLADLLKARGVIGDAVYANATNYGPNVTEYSRVKHLITAVQTSTRAMPQRYHDFIEVLQSDSIRPDAEAALVYLPTSKCICIYVRTTVSSITSLTGYIPISK